MLKRVYRGHCPLEEVYQSELGGNCRNCENFIWCVRRERRRRRRVLQIRRRIAIVVVVTLIFAAAFFFFFGACSMFAEAGNRNGTAVNGDLEETRFVNRPAESSIAVIPDEDSEDELMNEEEDETSEPVVVPEVVPVISAYGPGELYYYNLSYEDKVYIAKVVYVESRGEPYEGQVAVAATVLNRYVSNDERFDNDSIYSIITQSGQYASISGVTEEDLKSAPKCMKAVEDACKGWDPTRIAFEDGAKFFFNPQWLSEYAKKEREGIDTYPIGNHLFHNEFAC